jgi:aspartate/tyrosine/aromatic aminotransferase
MLVSQSYAKNFGLYSERVGTLSFVCTSADVAQRVLSQVKLIIRAQYSSPPAHGALIVARILENPQLKKEWEEELVMVSNRILEMRKVLKEELIKNKCKGNCDHITN